jgi:polyphosphate kinase
LFNALTGYSRQEKYRKLLVAPGGMKQAILERIERETKWQKKDGSGYLAFKMNSLVDKACIRALYKASQAGVRIDLQVRGICCLRPGAPRVSDNIRVTSVVGRFLEHTRIYYFHNGGTEEILLGSADLMPRNLKGRVETLFPVEDERLKGDLRSDILEHHLRDTAKCWELQPDGEYERIRPGEKEEPFDSQAHRLAHVGTWHREDSS